MQAIAAGWAEDPDTLPLLRDRATTDTDEAVRQAAVQAIAAGWAEDPDTLPLLRERATTDDRSGRAAGGGAGDRGGLGRGPGHPAVAARAGHHR